MYFGDLSANELNAANTPGYDSVWHSRCKIFCGHSRDGRNKNYEQDFTLQLDNTFSMT